MPHPFRTTGRLAALVMIVIASLAMPVAVRANHGTPVAVPADCLITEPLIDDEPVINGPPPVSPGWYLNEYIGASLAMWGEAGIVRVPMSHVTESWLF